MPQFINTIFYLTDTYLTIINYQNGFTIGLSPLFEKYALAALAELITWQWHLSIVQMTELNLRSINYDKDFLVCA